MEEYAPLFEFHLFGYNLEFPVNIVIEWAIIAVIAIIAIYLTSNLKKVPDKRQSVAETIVVTLNNLVKEVVGEKFLNIVPYIGTVAIFLLFMNLTGLFGFEPPTKSYGVALGMALISFLVIQGYTIKKIGLIHYAIGYTKPIFVITPLNILERVIVPLSLSLRLFGNMMASVVIMGIVYEGLRSMGWGYQIGIPIFVSLYFDIFDGALQMIIFTMLTMINIKIISDH
ncbi:MAG: F0F1 ATP synthase subunit A [Clostridiaceae bacterium]|nr:F0F1 ATP synthase subunit A [Clostridiaceae bacterium]